MTNERAAEILNPTHYEDYDSLETVQEACRMGMVALKMQIPEVPLAPGAIFDFTCPHCGSRDYLKNEDGNRNKFCGQCGKTQMVVGEFVCDKIYEVAPLNHTPNDFEQQACLNRDQIWKYLHGQGWAWHISELKIYDQPKPLETYTRLLQTGCCFEPLKVKRAPQSWCYVAEAEEDDAL